MNGLDLSVYRSVALKNLKSQAHKEKYLNKENAKMFTNTGLPVL